MVRNYKRSSNKRTTYNKEILDRALNEINRGLITQYGASKKYRIPQITLSYHRRGLRGKKSSSMGRSTAIPFNDETKLAECLTTMEKWGWGLTRNIILNTVQQYVTRNNLKTPFKDDRPGGVWYLEFLKRHHLSIKKPQSVEYARKKCMDPFVISKYFELLKEQIVQLGLDEKPRQVWNLAETDFLMDPAKTKVVGKRGAPSSRTTAGSGRKNTTVLMAVSADGFKAPPLIVFKAKKMWDEWVAPPSEAFPGTTYAVTKNGWMESNIFLNYFENSLLRVFGNERSILLIYDGHVSHVDLRLIKLARDNNVIILKLPPHSSHILQPLDLSVFKSLKVKWDKTIVEWKRHNEGRKIPKKKFSSIIGKIWKETDPTIITNGFKKAGIYPYNPNVIKVEQYDPAAYRRWEETQRILNKENGNDNSQPEPSEVKNVEFEELILATVKQSNPIEKVRKRRLATGAEVITGAEAFKRVKRNAITVTSPEEITDNVEIREEIEEKLSNNIAYEDSDDDVDEERRDMEDINKSLGEIERPIKFDKN